MPIKLKTKDFEIIDRETFNKGIDLLVEGKYANLPTSMKEKIKAYVKEQDLTKMSLGLQMQIMVSDKLEDNSIVINSRKSLTQREPLTRFQKKYSKKKALSK